MSGTGRVTWHTPMSSDGFIARHVGSMDETVAAASGSSPEHAAIEGELQSAGAILCGRCWYDTTIGRTDTDHAIQRLPTLPAVFVLTHRPPSSPHHSRVAFLDGDVRIAVATASRAAAGRNLAILGTHIAVQCLAAGLIDEIVLHLVPDRFGGGIRLLDTLVLGRTPLVRTHSPSQV